MIYFFVIFQVNYLKMKYLFSKCILFLILIGFNFNCLSQNLKDISINQSSIIKLNVNNFDFSFLDSLVKNKSIVMLGENSHSHGASITTINKIIKYLHSKLGYEALIMEDGMYQVISLDNILTKQKKFWGHLFECHMGPYYRFNSLGLYKYIDSTYRTNRPLKLYGGDLDAFSRECDSTNFTNIVDKYVFKHNSSLINSNWNDLKKDVFKIDSTKEICNNVYQRFIKLDSLVLNKDKNFHNELSYILLRGYILYHKNNWNTYNNPEYMSQYLPLGTLDACKTRDSLLALNIEWLLTKGPLKGKKVIIHFSGWHISNNITNLAPIENWSKNIPMCQLLSDSIKSKIYSICFINAKGQSGYMSGNALKFREGILVKPTTEFVRTKGLEAYLSKKGIKEAFVNFSLIDKNYKFYMCPTFWNEYLYNWSNVYSAAYYFESMEPIYDIVFAYKLKSNVDYQLKYEKWKKDKKVVYFDSL